MAGDTGLKGDGSDTPNQEPIALGASRRTSSSGMTPASGGFFQGSIDELAIINQQLTAAQVAELYSTPGVPYEIDEDNVLAVDAANGVLVNGFQYSNADLPIVEAIISMARALHLRIVAEGVENETQLEILRELGCHHAQGYYFSRPVPADEALAMLPTRARSAPA